MAEKTVHCQNLTGKKVYYGEHDALTVKPAEYWRIKSLAVNIWQKKSLWEAKKFFCSEHEDLTLKTAFDRKKRLWTQPIDRKNRWILTRNIARANRNCQNLTGTKVFFNLNTTLWQYKQLNTDRENLKLSKFGRQKSLLVLNTRLWQ